MRRLRDGHLEHHLDRRGHARRRLCLRPDRDHRRPDGNGAAATATVNAGAITAINLTAGGSGYITRRRHQEVRRPAARAVQPGGDESSGCHSSVPDGRQQVHPARRVGSKSTTTASWLTSIEIGLVQYRSSFSSSLPPSLVRGYVQLAGRSLSRTVRRGPSSSSTLRSIPLGTAVSTGWCGVTPPQYLGPVIAATKDKPVRIIFRNLLPKDAGGDLFLPTDSTLMGSGMADIPMFDPAGSDSVTDEARNPACTQTADAGSTAVLQGQPGDAAPARRHLAVDQRRHAAPVDHPGRRGHHMAAGRQRGERARHGTPLRLPTTTAA